MRELIRPDSKIDVDRYFDGTVTIDKEKLLLILIFIGSLFIQFIFYRLYPYEILLPIITRSAVIEDKTLDEKSNEKKREGELLLLVKELVNRVKENKARIELLSKDLELGETLITLVDKAILYKEADIKSKKITELNKDTELVLLNRIVLKDSYWYKVYSPKGIEAYIKGSDVKLIRNDDS